MAEKRFSRMLVLAKAESTYGVDSTPTVAANALQVTNATVTMQYDSDERPDPLPALGGKPKTLYGFRGTLSFDFELAGAGVAGQSPVYDPLERACGFASAAGVYDPVSEGFESITVYAYFDDALHKLVGVRGEWQETWSNGYPKGKATLQGIWVDPVDVTWPTSIDWSGLTAPVPVGGENTAKVTLHGYDFCASELTLQGGNQLRWRDLMGCQSMTITERDVTGSITVEPSALTDWDPWAIAKAGTLGNFSMEHGSVAGNILRRTGPAVQLMPPERVDVQGELMWRIALEFKPSSGDDEIQKVAA